MDFARIYPKASPAPPPTKANTPLSIKCCRNNRALVAPNARRTADSRSLATERDNKRFATLAHTISSSTPTSSIRIHSALASLVLRSEEHTSELQSRLHLVCRLLLEKQNTHSTKS